MDSSSCDSLSQLPSYSTDSYSGSSSHNSFLPTPSSSPPHLNHLHSKSSPLLSTSSRRSHRTAPRRSVTSFDLSTDPIASQQRAQAPHATSLTDHKINPVIETGLSSLWKGKFLAGGILDSPLVMREEELAAAESRKLSLHDKPLSPPLTLPLTTLTLPETETEFSPAHHEDEADASPRSEEENEEDGGSSSQLGPRKDTLSEDNEDTFSDLLRSEGADKLIRLSPLSPTPTWNPDLSVIPENSALLGSNMSSSLAKRRSRGSLVLERGRQPYKRNRCAPYTSNGHGFNSTTPPWSPRSLDATLPIDLTGPEPNVGVNSLEGLGDKAAESSFDSTHDPSSSTSYGHSLPTPASLLKPNLQLNPESEMDDLWTADSEGEESLSSDFLQRPFLQPLDIPKSSSHAPDSPFSIFTPHLFDDDYSMEVDHDSPISTPPSYPMISPYDTDLDTPMPHSPLAPSYAEPPPEPNSPLISKISLPDLSDEESHQPFSPSRRSFASLPDVEMNDPPDQLDSAPISPSGSLLSLPGADTDDDLLPPPPSNFKTPTPPQLPASRLLFIDDPRDVPLPRSPSPEDFDLNLIFDDDDVDPELTKLYNLRKKSVAAERAARHAEAQLIDAGSISLRAEATREKKKNKERSKELGALLRIKLGDKVPPEERNTAGIMGGISHLVAGMFFRRHETSRPLGHRKASASTPHDYVRSSLSRSTISDF